MKQIRTILCALILCAGCSTAGDEPVVVPADAVHPTQNRSAKRGLAFDELTADDVALLAQGIGWAYNWGPDVPASSVAEAFDRADIAFHPMAWNSRYDANRIRNWRTGHPKSDCLLAFNEPNLTDQARLTPQQAAAEWPRLKALADELGMKLIAPAMNYGTLSGYGDPIVWLDEFFSLVPIDDVAGIAIHCYMGSPASVKSFVRRFYKYGKPIWLTEFCAWEKNVSDIEFQRRYMAQVLGYLEADDHVAAYAWFIARSSDPETEYPYNPLFVTGSSAVPTVLGELYRSYTSMDRSVRFTPGAVIPAEQFVACNASESVSSEEWVVFPDVRPATDPGGTLELCELFFNQWVEYPVRIPDDAARTLSVRYSAPVDTQIEIACGNAPQLFTLPQTGNGNWETAELAFSPAAGDRPLRLTIRSGVASFNWLSVR